VGPLPGLEDPARLIGTLRGCPITGVIANPGIVRFIAPTMEVGLIVHLSAGTTLGARPASNALASSLERAIGLGADAVSVQVRFGAAHEDRMVADAGRVIDAGHSLGCPVLAMAYPASEPGGTSDDVQAARHAARVASEIGADLVQTNYAGPREGVSQVVRGCPAPLLLAGGPRSESPQVYLDTMREGIAAGAAGLTVGRNLFQHRDPAAFAARIGEVLAGAAVPLVPVGAVR
jgi:fructose-bisphosphate aldolase / 2-amino-3,7-dideoxy-D-threo-hept-6-ulosonate synthase